MRAKDKVRILVIDDDRAHAETTAESLERSGYACTLAFSGTEGAKLIEEKDFDIIVTDLVMRDLSGIDIIRRARDRRPDTEIIVITGYPSYETALEAIDEGAYDYLDKPIDLNILRAKLKKALEKQSLVRNNIELRRQIDKRYGYEGIIGQSAPMRKVFDLLQQVAGSDATVLITGESGTGKELVARAIHNNSPRKGHRFVPLNCAALSESLLESELFGHEKGAFTGAAQTRKGRFEYADKGTLFLDEIGDMPSQIQVKLLRVIEYGEVFRVGSNESLRTDVRLLAATNRDLDELVRGGTFREDLFFRLRVVTIHLPPLRERLDDLPLLVDHFIKDLSRVHRRTVKGITPAAMEVLNRYSWPGHVRELRNCIESMIVMSKKDRLDADDIPAHILRPAAPAGVRADDDSVNLEEAEKELIRQALATNRGNREKAAKQLGIGERTLYRKIKKYGLA
ncbi:MAG: sigma-54-dependent transcriptional regulator [Planctomycetota bacterium]|jgi:two-component system response regulator HydG